MVSFMGYAKNRNRDRYKKMKVDVIGGVQYGMNRSYQIDRKQFRAMCISIGKKMGGVDPDRVAEFYGAFIEEVTSQLQHTKICYLHGFGAFYLVKWRGRCFNIALRQKKGVQKERTRLKGYYGDRLVVRFEPNKKLREFFHAISRSIEIEYAKLLGKDPELEVPNKDEFVPIGYGKRASISKEAFEHINGQDLYDSAYPLKPKGL